MRIQRNRLKESQNGFTLAEMLIALVIIGGLIGLAYTFWDFSNQSYNHSEARQTVLQETNLFVSVIGTEIRSAKKPNVTTDSITLTGTSEAQVLDIYRMISNGTKCERVSYRINNGDLQRGSVEATETAYPYFSSSSGTISNWKTVVHGVSNPDNDSEYFTVTAPEGMGDARLVAINFEAVGDSGLITNPVQIITSFLSRSQGMSS